MIPTASMADIAFLLIVFFMVTITFEKDKTQVALPKTELRFEVPKEAAYISVTDSGQIRVTNGEEMSVPVAADDVVTFAANLVSEYPRPAGGPEGGRRGAVSQRRQDHRFPEAGQGRAHLPALRAEDRRRRRSAGGSP